MTVKELVEQRVKVAADARAILDLAEKEKRALTAEEETKWGVHMTEIDKLAERIDRQEKAEREERMASVERELETSRGRITDPARPKPKEQRDQPSGEERALAFRAWCRVPVADEFPHTEEELNAVERCGMSLQQKKVTIRLLPRQERTVETIDKAIEKRAQGVATGAAGLFTVPDEAMRPLEVALLAFGGMRKKATVLRTATGADLPIPTVNDTTNKGVILAENTGAAEQDLVFAQIVLKSFKYSSKMLKVSVELMQDSAVNLAVFVGEALGERIGRILNDHFTTGAGTTEPKGIVTEATSAFTAASATTVTTDELIDLQYSVDQSYRSNPGAAYMFADASAKIIRKLKGGDGQYIWQPSILAGQPDTLLGHDVVINQSMPAMTAGLKAVLFGDIGKYLIRDVMDITLVRLDERFAEAHQVGFLAFSRHEGRLLNAGTNPVKVITQL
jgi:HK97 family phage major capsid protein